MKKILLCLILVGCTNKSYEPIKLEEIKAKPTQLQGEELEVNLPSGTKKTYIKFEIDNKVCLGNYFDASIFCYDKQL